MSASVRAAIIAPIVIRKPGKRIEINAYEIAQLRALQGGK